ncbi:MAG: CotH kinase family protein [Ginsengibacter sp.]
MVKKPSLYPILLLITVFASCRKEPASVTLSNLKDILDFKIEASLNKNVVAEDIPGVISNDTISLTISSSVDLSHLIATFSINGNSVFIGNVKQESGVTVNDFTKKLSYSVTADDGSERSYAISVKIKIPDLKQGVPHLFIQTENNVSITSKDDYVKATLKIEGLGVYEDYEGTTKIKGRGNSTWNYPKKPYRLKLDAAASLLGLPADKDWILLANYLDPTLMLNAIAMETGQLLKMPYTNTIIPVDVTINGTYMGNYTFTEQKEVAPNRVDLEEGSVWLEMDTYYDEDYKFKSAYYNLPVMVHYPELEDYTQADAATELAKIQTDFNTMEQAVASGSFPNNNYLDYIDAPSIVNYLIVYNLCQNEEINHPKSTYLYKHKGGKYMMGEIWDFDWAYDYEDDNVYFNDYSKSLFWTGSKAQAGTKFFSRFMTDPVIKTLYKQEWSSFKINKLPLLLQYLDEYAALITDSQKKDYAVWKTGNGDFKGQVQKLRTWLQNRASYIDSYVKGF